MVLVDGVAAIIGIAQDDYTLKLAIFHTIFNVAGVIIMVPLVNQLVALVSTVIPVKEKQLLFAEPKYLNNAAIHP